MQILIEKYFKTYEKNLSDFHVHLEKWKVSSKELDFSYMTESSSVFSSNIEGNSLDLSSFMNLRSKNAKAKEREEIENLIEAYLYAQGHTLSEINFLHTHRLASRTLLIDSLQWVYRKDKVGVFWKSWLIYLALEAEYVPSKMSELFIDIATLIENTLSTEEIFYYASLIHLFFVHIHPFADGNGRSARLLEKWFLATKLGKEYWKISSEYYYKENRNEYYKNLNLWVNYYELDYDRCIPFLLMLSKSLSR